MVEILVSFEGGFRTVSTHVPSGALLPTDAPKDNLGEGNAYSPTDLTATSLVTCMLTTMAIMARKNSLPVELAGAKGRVRKYMTSEPPRRIAKLEVDIDIPNPISSADRATLERVAKKCPAALSLHPDVEQAVAFHWAE
ncbi:OsmC family protein [soil metagenome]